MDQLFLFCAVIGGSVMIVQFALTFLGLGHDGGDLGGVGDVGHLGDVGHSGHIGHIGHIGDAGDVCGIDGADIAAAHEGHAGFAEAANVDVDGAAASHLFGVLSFRTVVAALTFFGIAGKASRAADFDTLPALLFAIAAGAAAMYGVCWLMQAIYRLRSEGNVRIRDAVGLRGTVYVPIPADRSGAGKIQINLQNRTMEYQAMTDDQEKLPTGARIVVTSILGPDTVAVTRIPATVDVGAES